MKNLRALIGCVIIILTITRSSSLDLPEELAKNPNITVETFNLEVPKSAMDAFIKSLPSQLPEGKWVSFKAKDQPEVQDAVVKLAESAKPVSEYSGRKNDKSFDGPLYAICVGSSVGIFVAIYLIYLFMDKIKERCRPKTRDFSFLVCTIRQIPKDNPNTDRQLLV